jgi:hypothetical protein
VPVTDRRSSLRDARWALVLVPALLVVGTLAILATDTEPSRGVKGADVPAPVEATPGGDAGPTPEPAKGPVEPSPVGATPDGGLNVVGPRARDPREPGMHPHPFTPEHRRLHAENELVQRLNDAMAARDVPKMRELVVAYRALDPTDVDRSQLGYDIIADCIEHPGETSVARAKEFYGAERHSPLRRFVRRICFENRD